MWPLAYGYHEDRATDTGLRADARGGDGGVREELAARGLVDDPSGQEARQLGRVGVYRKPNLRT
jgi:hypothetical protein